MMHRGERIDLSAIRRVALMTVEGEKDDITGLGQCEAALKLCVNLQRSKKRHYTQPGVGHYGIFNGARFKNDIVPKVTGFMADHDRGARSNFILSRLFGGRRDRIALQPIGLVKALKAPGTTQLKSGALLLSAAKPVPSSPKGHSQGKAHRTRQRGAAKEKG
jgi:hypothetical protein